MCVYTVIIVYCQPFIRELTDLNVYFQAYGGLRGAVAFSLVAMLDPHMCHKELFVTATFAVITFTVFIQVYSVKYFIK